LLASFVLIPITVIITLHFPLFIANRWDLVRIMMAGLLVMTVALIRTGVKTFNREEILSREHEQLNLRATMQHFLLCFREYQPAGVPFSEYRGDDFSPGRFYRHELPTFAKELRVPFVLVLAGGVSGLLFGVYLGLNYTVNGLDIFLQEIGNPPKPGIGLALFIFVNNLRVSIFSNILSTFAFGILAFLVPLAAFLQIGLVAGTLARQSGNWLAMGADSPLQFVLAYVVPHGIIELPTFLLSAALGVRLGVSLLPPPGTFTVGQHMLWGLANFAKVWLLVLLPLVLLAALVEGLVTPLVVSWLY
jgi:uncharacterized membrane protein SpoIIM required for sporulation